jgi:glycosidase
MGQTVKVEPPFWWVGMTNPNLQLMVYEEGVGSAAVSTNSMDLKIVGVHDAESPNYLFIDLEISREALSGTYPLTLTLADGSSKTIEYELKERRPGSTWRKGFNSSDVIYLITPDRFANGDPANDEIAGMKEGLNRAEPYGRHGGDIKGILDHLDYIKDMGFTSVWLNPILENDQPQWSYHGYSTTDFYRVDPRFGTNEEYLALSQALKDMGMGMIMDVIVNHCGDQHWWMQDPPFSDWFNRQDKPFMETTHRKTTLRDPYVSSYDRKALTEGWFVATMPDLNQRNPFMATYLIQNSIWWIEYADLYGLRQDTYSYPFRDFMTDWSCAIMDEYPNFNIVGEEWVKDAAIISYWQRDKVNSDGYFSCTPSLMDFPMCLNLADALKEKEDFFTGFIKLYEGLAEDYVYAHPEDLVIFPDNHDMSRIFTRVEEDLDKFKQAVAYILTMRGVPQLYYGTEILMDNTGTDSHGVIRSDYPGGWKEDHVNAFTSEGLSQTSQEVRSWLKSLLQWRKDKTVIHNGDLMHFVPTDSTYTFVRYDDDDKVVVILNKNTEAIEMRTDRYSEILPQGSTLRNVLTGEKIKWEPTVILPAEPVFILETADD